MVPGGSSGSRAAVAEKERMWSGQRSCGTTEARLGSVTVATMEPGAPSPRVGTRGPPGATGWEKPPWPRLVYQK